VKAILLYHRPTSGSETPPSSDSVTMLTIEIGSSLQWYWSSPKLLI